MATSSISVTQGSGKNVATHSLTEDAVTKEIQRIALSTSAGADISPLSESDFDTKIGALTETAPATDTASSGLNGRLQRIAQRITSLIALLPTALTASGNFKVSLQESNASQAVTAASLPLPTGAATETTLGTRLSESDFDTKSGSLTEIAPATDTASSGLNGRLQRIAQRLTSLIALVPAALTGSGNFKVAVQEALPAGTNNIGDVDVLTQPARAATTDTITAKLATDAIMNGTTALTPKFTAIAAATSGDNTLVAAVASKKIRVLGIMGVVSAATNIYFADGAATVIFGGSTNKINLAANGGFVLPFNPAGWFETAAGQLLKVNLSAANSFSGGLVYVEV